MNEMYKLMACWKSNGFIDSHCKEEIDLFQNCVSKQVFLMIFLILDIKGDRVSEYSTFPTF